MRKIFLLLATISLFSIAELQAQRAYIQHFESLADSAVLEQVIDLVQLYPDSALRVGQASSDRYFEQGDTLRGIFAFLYTTYYLAGYGHRELAIPLMLNFIADKSVWTDTLSIHYGTFAISIGFAYKIGEQRELSRAYYQRGRAIYDAIPESVSIPAPIIAEFHQSYGSLIQSMGDIYGGYYHLTKAMTMLESLDNPYGLAHCYLELSISCDELGQSLLANDLNLKALGIIQEHFPVSFNHVVVASNQAQRCIDLEDYKGALYWSNYADSVIHALGYKENLIWPYLAIVATRGISNRHMKNYHDAREAFDLLIETILECCYGPVLGNAYTEFVYLLMDQGELDEAMSFAHRAKEMNPYLPEAVRVMGEIALRQKDYSNSISYFTEALGMLAGKGRGDTIPNQFTSKDFAHTTSSYQYVVDLAKAYFSRYQNQGDDESLSKAYSMANLADSLFDIYYQASIIGVYSERIAREYHAFSEFAYRVASTIHAQKPSGEYLEQLVTISSKSKALSLSTQLKLSSLSDASDSLRQRQHEVLVTMRTLENNRIAHDNRGEPVSDELKEQLFRSRLAALDLALRMHENPSKPIPDGFNLADFQERLNPKQAIITYQLFDSLLVGILISKNQIHIFENQFPSEYEGVFRDYIRALKVGDTGFKSYGERLHGILLKPFVDELLHYSHLHIIPDGILSQIPFEAFWMGNRYLLQEHQITYGYLLPTYEWFNRNSLPQNPNFLGVAPVFNYNQLASNNTLRAIEVDESIDLRSLLDSRDRLIALPHTSREVEAIARIFGSEGYATSNLIGDLATEDRFHSIASGYTVLHLATHGVSSGRSPELSGLFFSTKGDKGVSTHDGFLHFGELFSLSINADLVVLSACQSGVGRVMRGEGVMSLPRGLLAAGVPNVIASLWKVHDERTKDLMVAFYRHLFDGNTYAEALRLAKLECIERGFLPLDWAGFVLIGG